MMSANHVLHSLHDGFSARQVKTSAIEQRTIYYVVDAPALQKGKPEGGVVLVYFSVDKNCSVRKPCDRTVLPLIPSP